MPRTADALPRSRLTLAEGRRLSFFGTKIASALSRQQPGRVRATNRKDTEGHLPHCEWRHARHTRMELTERGDWPIEAKIEAEGGSAIHFRNDWAYSANFRSFLCQFTGFRNLSLDWRRAPKTVDCLTQSTLGRNPRYWEKGCNGMAPDSYPLPFHCEAARVC